MRSARLRTRIGEKCVIMNVCARDEETMSKRIAKREWSRLTLLSQVAVDVSFLDYFRFSDAYMHAFTFMDNSVSMNTRAEFHSNR
jgi:hypothetical protein